MFAYRYYFLKHSVMNFKEISQHSESILKEHNAYSVYIDVKMIVRALDIQILEREDWTNELSGALVIHNGKGVIGLNKYDVVERKRYTLAHELGHWFLHNDLTDTFLDKKLVFNRSNHSNRQEVEANYFAACMLMPEKLLRNQINLKYHGQIDEDDISSLAGDFKVSAIAMTYRLTNLELI